MKSLRRLLIVGDLHGNENYFKHVINAANEKRCDAIVQCGDIGYWPHTSPNYFDNLTSLLIGSDLEREENDLPPLKMFWVDGNHENFDALQVGDWLHYDGFAGMTPRIFYAPRGHRWEWEGTKFLALGGANSIDKQYRVEGRSWWKQELITPEDVDRAIEGGTVDVMICHDMPKGVLNGPDLFHKDQAVDEMNRYYVRVVMDAVKPKLLYHGHYHYRYESLLNETMVVGLDCDGHFEKNWTVLDLPLKG